jgi:hypothetical protein
MLIRVGATAVESTSITIPTHKIGDLIIMFAFRDGSATNPTIGTGSPTVWTSITSTTDGTSCSVSMAWKIATSTAELSGTWTNATDLVCLVYRGHLSSGTPIGTFAPGSGTTNTVNYAARTLTKSNIIGDSWFIAFAGHRSADTTLESPPTNMALISGSALVASSSEVAAFDTNGPAPQDWPSTNVSISGTASGWQTEVIEIKVEPWIVNNYKFPSSSVGNTGIISIGEKIR